MRRWLTPLIVLMVALAPPPLGGGSSPPPGPPPPPHPPPLPPPPRPGDYQAPRRLLLSDRHQRLPAGRRIPDPADVAFHRPRDLAVRGRRDAGPARLGGARRRALGSRPP